MDGSRYIIRNDIPHIVAQSNPEIRVFDPQTRDYTPVHTKNPQQIMADARLGKILSFASEGTPSVHLKDYKLISLIAQGKNPVVAIIPQQVSGAVRERGSYGEGRLDRVSIPIPRGNIPTTFRKKNGAIQI